VAASVELVGGDRAAATMRAAADRLRHLADVNAAAGDRIAAATRSRARRRTGRLPASFTVTADDAGATVGSGLVYAGVQEFGSRSHNITPSLALTGAFDAQQPAVVDLYRVAAEQTVSEVKGK
jgi:phage gpG-like protein